MEVSRGVLATSAFTADRRIARHTTPPLWKMGEAAPATPADAKRVELQVKGMTCGSCVSSIETMLGQQPGIRSVSVALLAERAVVEYDEAQGWTPQKIADEIDDIGFEAQVIEPVSYTHL